MCDDLYHYMDGNYTAGNWKYRKELGGDNINFIYDNFQDSHEITINNKGGGCIVILPKK